MIAVYIIIAVLVVVVFWLIGVYNGLIKLRNRTDEAWSDIDVQLKRRHDLIPNLVETVKGYASHEKKLFENVTKARSEAMQAKTPEEHAKAENALTATLKSLFAVAENYPELRASENFAKLQDELSDTENKIQASRRFYNGNVRDFNTRMQVFPNNLIASMLGFKKYEFFEIEEMERETPEVKF
ncbi:LemA family protein [Candidatus Saccharibacteria bacterium]|nr:LemA family protein [Candidatus Saccharibacteria bacterium]NIV04289.1 LemA family protein [Calditrichia bacterium]NIS38831.1 LemA family protein [Candidatus Saccharibacteria bacterium]NIV72784.1 LemA family protein [Calditrichia bacterium]NIV99951.1 LemA family protein [Candidatus Saccharibacteria bacterium]